MKRHKTDYPGVFYREGTRIGGKGIEKIFYAVYKKAGKTFEEKAGRQYADDMTPARAAGIRAELVEGKRLTRKEVRNKERSEKAEKKWTVDRLFKEYKDRNPGLKGWPTYNSQYDLWIKPDFGKKEPEKILQLDVDRLRLRMLKKRSPQTVKHVLSLLRRVIRFGVRKQLCVGLSFEIEMPDLNNEKTEDLTSDELKRLLKEISTSTHPQAGPMMQMALYSGIRRGEMFKLTWNDVKFNRGFVHIRDPKGGPDQKVPLNDASRELLKGLPKNSQFVFPGRGGNQRTNISKQTRKIADAAGLSKDFRPLHGLRHVYASMLASSGEVDLYTLQKLLTHKDPKMTQRYAHLRDYALKQAANVAGNIILDATQTKDDQKVVNLEDHKK
jgi:integrase